MTEDLSNYRKSYDKFELNESDVDNNPFKQFQKWFREIDNIFPEVEANAMTLSTIGTDGFPKGRVVLLKSINKEGFIFYTNYNSSKGQDIKLNPNVGLSFFWDKAERQIIIKGTAEKIDPELSEAYFQSRPRESRLGAWASNQSEVIENAQVLVENMKSLEDRFSDSHIPRPEHWGGYIVKPIEFEFWQGRPSRLHDRIRYCKNSKDNWIIERLAP
ncbi:pyridoxamine 5'-phosphate oxidase [Aegicerativicinus sediminis]